MANLKYVTIFCNLVPELSDCPPLVFPYGITFKSLRDLMSNTTLQLENFLHTCIPLNPERPIPAGAYSMYVVRIKDNLLDALRVFFKLLKKNPSHNKLSLSTSKTNPPRRTKKIAYQYKKRQTYENDPQEIITIYVHKWKCCQYLGECHPNSCYFNI